MRKLRCTLWKQWGGRGYRELRKRGVSRDLAWNTSKSAHGPWRISMSPALSIALPTQYFVELGLTRYIHLNPVKVKGLASSPSDSKREGLWEWLYGSYRGSAGLAEPERRVDYRWLAVMGRRSGRENRRAYRGYAESMLGKEDMFLSDASQRALALYVGYGSESAVGKTRKRVQAALSQDPGFADAEREILRRLSVAQRVTGDNIASQDSKF